MSNYSIAQPLSPPRQTTRSPALVELRLAIEAGVAQRLLHATLNSRAGSMESAGQCGADSLLIVRLSIAPAGCASRLHTALRLGEEEIDLGAQEVNVIVSRGQRMLHVDARARDAQSPALSASIELVSGRIVFARSSIPAELGLRGGTYDAPTVAIQWA